MIETARPLAKDPRPVSMSERPDPGEGPGLADFMGASALAEGSTVVLGSPRPVGSPAADRDGLIAALSDIYDPEIPVNIYDLGLIYDLVPKPGGDVDVTMTLTAPSCPVAGDLVRQVAQAAAKLNDTGTVTVRLTWEPQWTPAKMSEDAKLALDLI